MNNKYDVLFEPLKIGPVTTQNRFYQVPHCTGMGYLRPRADAAVRAMKAEGGWGVVCSQETEIHPTSDLSPFPENRLWDDRDIPALRIMSDAIHEHDSLAGVQLVHNGYHAYNLASRAPLFAPSDTAMYNLNPRQARAMDKQDIRNLRQWHRAAARRAKEAGFDIVYVYAGHNMTIAQHFLTPALNERTDEYGGSLENRARLMRELLEETKEEIGDSCAVALRFAVDQMQGADGMQAHEEGRAVVEMLAELPDLWDVNIAGWDSDSATSRFAPDEGYQTPYIEFVKQVTTKPVVAVGRFTSPDLMASMVKKGIVDLIGAARPSIADPFIPAKIREDRIEEIRECIGCNICVASDSLAAPIRCTQNPTMGEEWRRKWHPEKINPKGSEEAALVVGAGPSGLECAMQLARRGYKVTLAEASGELGGRSRLESTLPGLNAWKRVADYRIYDLQQRGNVETFLESELSAEQVLELGIPNVFLATGARWRRDGIGRHHRRTVPDKAVMPVLTPDDILAGELPPVGPVLLYDDDQIYLGGVLAEFLRNAGHEVILVTPASIVSPWTENTLEQDRIQSRLIELGVRILTQHALQSIDETECVIACTYSGREETLACTSVMMVTERIRNTEIYDLLKPMQGHGTQPLKTIELLGDAASPGLIADAVYSGHMAARHFEMEPESAELEYFQREIIALEEVNA